MRWTPLLVFFTAINSALLLVTWYNASPKSSAICYFPCTSSEKQNTNDGDKVQCDYSKGKWIRHQANPLYNGSCVLMKDSLNCLRNGRPDKEYLNWKWQPKSCNLPRFDPHIVLEMHRNKHIAFIGDSIAWNQLESFICMVSSVSSLKLRKQLHQSGERFHYKKWEVESNFNVTISGYWSPFLVQGNERNDSFPQNEVFTDRANEFWLNDYHFFDTVVITVGRWYYLPGIFYTGEKDNILLGCHICSDSLNITQIEMSQIYKRILKNSFKAIVGKMRSNARKGNHVIINSLIPMHYEGEAGVDGVCWNTLPYEEGEKELFPFDIVMREAAIEEVEAVSDEVSKFGGFRMEIMDITKLSWWRSDAHPGLYRFNITYDENTTRLVKQDCLHWCLPGAVDTWNEILLQLMKRWRMASQYQG